MREKLLACALYAVALTALATSGCGPQNKTVQTNALFAGSQFTSPVPQTYFVRSVYSGMVLDDHGGETVGARVLQSAPSSIASQQFTFVADANGNFAIIGVSSQNCLGIDNVDSTDGPALQMAACMSGGSQQWHVVEISGIRSDPARVKLVNVGAEACLNVAGTTATDVISVQGWRCRGGESSQQFQLLPVPTPTTIASVSDANTVPSTSATPHPSPTPVASSAPSPVTSPSGTPTPIPTPSATSPAAPSYGLAQITADMQNVLQSRTPIYSNRNLGNPSNIALWTPNKLTSLLNAIATAQAVFYSNISLEDLAHLVLAEGAQESTGNYDAQGGALGYMQATPGSVGQDFINHGLPISSTADLLISPQVTIDYDDPGQSVALWAWYTYNAVAAGESVNQATAGEAQGGVTRDFGNAAFCWIAGPGNDRHNPAEAPAFADYHDRIEDYFVQSGFGTADRFESLLNTSVGTMMIDVH